MTAIEPEGLDPEHHQHDDPYAGDMLNSDHDHDGLPPHFHRHGMVINRYPEDDTGG